MLSLRVLEVPFDSDRKLMSTVNHVDKQEFVYTKGALDQLLLQCNRIYLNKEIVSLTEAMKEKIQEEALYLSSQALCVLAFAFKKKDQQEIETDLIFLGCSWNDWPHHAQKLLKRLERHMKQELE